MRRVNFVWIPMIRIAAIMRPTCRLALLINKVGTPVYCPPMSRNIPTIHGDERRLELFSFGHAFTAADVSCGDRLAFCFLIICFRAVFGGDE